MGKIGKKKRDYAQRNFDKQLSFLLRENLQRGDMRQLSTRIDISYPMLSNYLNGHYSLTVYNFVKLVKAMHLDIQDVLEAIMI